jgi:hypothetical protein
MKGSVLNIETRDNPTNVRQLLGCLDRHHQHTDRWIEYGIVDL